jgi:hypothetical protein
VVIEKIMDIAIQTVNFRFKYHVGDFLSAVVIVVFYLFNNFLFHIRYKICSLQWVAINLVKGAIIFVCKILNTLWGKIDSSVVGACDGR